MKDLVKHLIYKFLLESQVSLKDNSEKIYEFSKGIPNRISRKILRGISEGIPGTI